ncbi:MAG TPA: HAMP domain-containing sensor histidine kinase [Streptosporangiaceae bacterium]|jgi:signal transduction histidine kinase|nr:HAMP domain-containing sensor histidine kinase [Streptosporangiaceae bacterium]
MPGSRIRYFIHAYRVDLAWVAFVLLNLLAMQLIIEWQTIPFLIIWISLTAVYGWRLWRFGSALATVLVVTLATGGLIGLQVLRGEQDGDYLAEVPLLALLFVVMVWHSRRRLAAVEEIERVSARNLALLDQQRQFLQDASHELGTPIAIALGHAELIERAATDQRIAADARITVEELLRMRRLTSRLLLLASTDSPQFLHLAPVDVENLVVETLARWSHVPRRWSVGTLEEAWIHGDADRLTLAIDALIENAVDHTETDGGIELSARHLDDTVIVTVADEGSGIPAAELSRVFSRFSRVDAGRNRAAGGFGLGLAIVNAIAQAHRGAVQVTSTVGEGSAFELRLPASPVPVGAPASRATRTMRS